MVQHHAAQDLPRGASRHAHPLGPRRRVQGAGRVAGHCGIGSRSNRSYAAGGAVRRVHAAQKQESVHYLAPRARQGLVLKSISGQLPARRVVLQAHKSIVGGLGQQLGFERAGGGHGHRLGLFKHEAVGAAATQRTQNVHLVGTQRGLHGAAHGLIFLYPCVL